MRRVEERKSRLATCGTAVAAALVLVVGGCGGDDSQTSTATAETTAATPAQAGCSDVDAPAAREDGGASAPSERLDPEKTWTLTFDTSCGTFEVTLDTESAPATAASLVSLARAGFYDDTVFHRIVPGFVIQGGDRTQTGTGGPGYSTVDPPATDASYVKGVVAMAKTQDEPAGTAGSQFFVVTGDDVGLPPDYAVVGKVTKGLDVVELIGTMGDPATEQPLQPIVVESVTASSA
jgi:peptidyl-prolyl cis-trans isomerase B (cyclophilin B)